MLISKFMSVEEAAETAGVSPINTNGSLIAFHMPLHYFTVLIAAVHQHLMDADEIN